TMVRISKIEIIGTNRTNRKMSDANMPSVPTKVAQSHTVPAYAPHEDGRKSRLRLVTTITKRSSHMPVFTMSEIRKRSGMFVRTFLNHSVCGMTPLQKMSVQYAYQYRPNIRLWIMKPSYSFAAYHPKNASVV